MPVELQAPKTPDSEEEPPWYRSKPRSRSPRPPPRRPQPSCGVRIGEGACAMCTPAHELPQQERRVYMALGSRQVRPIGAGLQLDQEDTDKDTRSGSQPQRRLPIGARP